MTGDPLGNLQSPSVFQIIRDAGRPEGVRGNNRLRCRHLSIAASEVSSIKPSHRSTSKLRLLPSVVGNNGVSGLSRSLHGAIHGPRSKTNFLSGHRYILRLCCLHHIGIRDLNAEYMVNCPHSIIFRQFQHQTIREPVVWYSFLARSMPERSTGQSTNLDRFELLCIRRSKLVSRLRTHRMDSWRRVSID